MTTKQKKSEIKAGDLVICATCLKHVTIALNGKIRLHTLISGETLLCPNTNKYSTLPVKSL